MERSLAEIVIDAQRQAVSLFSRELIFSCFDSSLHIISLRDLLLSLLLRNYEVRFTNIEISL